MDFIVRLVGGNDFFPECVDPESSDSGEWLDNGEDGGDSGDGFLDGDGDDGGSFWGGISEILRGGSDSF